LFAEALLRDGALELGTRSGPSPTMVAVTVAPLLCKLPDRGDQHVDALEQPQFADKQQVGCALPSHTTGWNSSSVTPL
jgi:hypothetical protein